MKLHAQKWIWLCALIVGMIAVKVAAAAGEKQASLVLILAQSGIAAEDNRPALEAAQLAVEEVNDAGGLLARPLIMTVFDNQSTPLGSKAAARKAIDSGAIAVVGAIWSSHCLAMAPVMQSAGMPMVTPTASMPDVTQVGDCIFRACFIDSFQGKVMAQFARTDLGAKTAGVFINVNEAYSQELARFFETAFVKAGGLIQWTGKYSGSAVDFTQLLMSASASGVDIFFLPGYARDAGLLLKQGRKMGLRQIFLGGDGWGTKIEEYAAANLDGCYYSTHWHLDTDIPKSRRLLAKYRQRYPAAEVNDIRIPLTYDAVMLVADAVRRAKSSDHQKIRDALAHTAGFQGATGNITFDGNGDPVDKQAAIVKWEGHQQKFLKTVQP